MDETKLNEPNDVIFGGSYNCSNCGELIPNTTLHAATEHEASCQGKINLKHKLIDIVKNNTAKFIHYTDGKLFYQITLSDGSYIFPINIDDKNDIGNAIFNHEEKAVLLMRYIRKAMQNEELRFIPNGKAKS